MSETIAVHCSTKEPQHMTTAWRTHQGGVYRCPVDLVTEEDGTFSVLAVSLPGVASQGSNEQEALDNIIEAFQGVMETYKEIGKQIPWLDTMTEPEQGSFRRWVVVHV